MTSTADVVRWLLRVTAPVLRPLAVSVVFRHVERLAGFGLLVAGVATVARLAAEAGGQPVPETSWLPTTAVALLVTLTLLSVVKGVSRYLEQFFGHMVAFKALELLRVELYRALVPQAPMAMHKTTSGDLLMRATKDIDRIEVFFAHTVAPAITAATVPAIAVVAVGGGISWPVAGVLAVSALISGVLIPWFGSARSLAAAGRVARLRGVLGQHATDSMQGMTEIVGYGHAARRLDEMTGLDERIGSAQEERGRVQASRAGLQTITAALTTLAAVVTGLVTGLDLISLAITAAVGWKLFDSTTPVSDFMASLDASLAAANRVHAIVIAPPAVTDPDDAVVLPDGPLSVVWRDVRYRYPGSGPEREPSVDGITIEVPAGSHCCLAGVSGSGKSTLLSLALRFDDPADGEVLLGGVDIRRVRLDDLRSRVALVSQTTFLLHGTIAENLRLAAPAADDEQLWQALCIAHLDAEVRDMSDGLETPVGEHGQQLSGGQRQRLALARALLSQADVFLLDEFTAHLDPMLAARVRESLRAARPGATIVESTHDLQGIRDADQVIALDQGRIAPEALERLLDA
ncbi:MAG: ABC transporter ATP-binding protein [Tessaracoccus sp.]